MNILHVSNKLTQIYVPNNKVGTLSPDKKDVELMITKKFNA